MLDLIAIGRSSVDLYGQQVGGRLEDVASFSKAVGGCPANIAIGSARLGLRSGLITRVGDEAMGRFIREQLGREGVDTRGVVTDATRLTALVLLGVRDDHSFPMIFYRSDCADAALDESDIDENYILSARAIVVTGTHFALPKATAAQRKAIGIARKAGRRVVFDIDYRPNLWGLGGHDAGESRYAESTAVTQRLQTIVPDCDLIVGTEEEWHIAGGSEDTLAALRAARALSSAVFVVKRGPMGCVVFPDAIPASLDDGIQGSGFPVEVYNVLGAGDAFMSGLLYGWLRGEPIERCCMYANACGAFAVSRLLCSIEYPRRSELEHFLAHGSATKALRQDAQLNHLHWSTTRDALTPRTKSDQVLAFAIDHRAQLEAMADAAGAPRARINAFKKLALQATLEVAGERPGYGILLDGTYGREALFEASRHNLWIARPIEQPGSRPFDIEGGGSFAAQLTEWPTHQVIKALVFYHPDDPLDLHVRQDRELVRLHAGARALRRELMVEIIAGKHGSLADDAVARVLDHLYEIGVAPDWWKLEAQPDAASWAAIGAVIERRDPLCRGVLLLGLDAPEDQIAAAIRLASREKCVKGFAIGRTIFGACAREWLAGRIDDGQAVARMAAAYGRLTTLWDECRKEGRT